MIKNFEWIVNFDILSCRRRKQVNVSRLKILEYVAAADEDLPN